MTDQETRISEIRSMIRGFMEARGWGSHSPKNLAISISIESAELMEIFQWDSLEEARRVRENPAKFEHLKEEIADVMVYLLSMADQLDIDVSQAIADKMVKNGRKYPAKEA